MASRRHAGPKALEGEGTLVVDADPDGWTPGPDGWYRRYEGDLPSIALLLFLYTLQGIPMGLAASVPLILQERNISYKEQAVFSLVSWPFSLKLLWAPLVDSLYSPRFGRRKSWLVPVQLAIGVLLLGLGRVLPALLGDTPESPKPDVWTLTWLFGVLYALAATQDIAVDGWALTMLSRKNVGMASTCNTIGQMLGYLAAFVLFLAFNSADFCNRWFRAQPQAKGMLSLPTFMTAWGYMFVASTVLVGILKTESSQPAEGEASPSLVAAYQQMWQLCRMPHFRTLILLLLTCKVGFGAADAITTLKLIEKGVPKETMGALAVAITPLTVLGTAYVSHHTSGPRPLSLFMQAYPCRLALGLVFVPLVWLAPTTTHSVSPAFFALVTLITAVHQLACTFIFVALISFFARISDPTIGGTSMTLLNTVTNLGAKWPQTLALSLVESASVRRCTGVGGWVSCATAAQAAACTQAGGLCHTYLDGFTLLSGLGAGVGVGWLLLFGRTFLALQEVEDDEWMLRPQRRRV